jgi:hypothetical protein
LTVQEHVDSPIGFLKNLIPDSGKADLVPGSKAINFIEPKTSKEVANRNMLPYHNTSFRDICRDTGKQELYQRQRTGNKTPKENQELAPTTYNRKLGLRIWSQTLLFIKFNLKVNGGIFIFSSSFICLSFIKHIKASIMSRNCKSSIFPPQEPEE